MPVKIVVLNNGGIGSGVAELPDRPAESGTEAADGGRALRQDDGGVRRQGLVRQDPKDLHSALDEAMEFNGPALVNVKLHHAAGRKPQEFTWLTT